MSEWKPIGTLTAGETVVRLLCDDGKERKGWRHDGDRLEVAGTDFMVIDASKHAPDGIAVYATHWQPLPPSPLSSEGK